MRGPVVDVNSDKKSWFELRSKLAEDARGMPLKTAHFLKATSGYRYVVPAGKRMVEFLGDLDCVVQTLNRKRR